MSGNIESMSRIRTAARWMKRTGEPIEKYPKRALMSQDELHEATQFACGNYPWPSRWTIRLYNIARLG